MSKAKLFIFCSLLVLILTIVGSRGLPIWAALVVVPLVIVAIGLVGAVLVRFWWKNAILTSMRLASRVLRGAQIEYHSIAVVAPPAALLDEDAEQWADCEAETDSEEDPFDLRPDRYVSIEMTVVPDQSAFASSPPDPGVAPESGSAPELADENDYWNPDGFVLVAQDNLLDESAPPLPGVDALQAPARGYEVVDTKGEVLYASWDDEAATHDEQDEESIDHSEAYQQREYEEFRGAMRVRVLFSIPRAMPGRVKLRYFLEEWDAIELP